MLSQADGRADGRATEVSSSVLDQINARLGEIRDDVKDLKGHVDEKFDKVATDYVTKELLKAMLQPYQADIASLKEDRKKLVWIIIGAVLLAVISLVISGTGGSLR
jgi:hypothetical protein